MEKSQAVTKLLWAIAAFGQNTTTNAVGWRLTISEEA
jgi:hypothetical protein